MGVLHEMKETLTAKDLAKLDGVTVRAINTRWNAKFPGVLFDSNAELSPEQVRELREAGKRKSRKQRAQQTGEKPAAATRPISTPSAPRPVAKAWKWPTKKAVYSGAVGLLLVGCVIGHAALVWYDCAQLWDVPGTIGGGVMFALIVAAVLLASDSEMFSTSGDSLVFVFFIDGAAWFVHYEVFKTPIVSDLITGALCAFLCAGSFFALYLYRQFKFQ